jgi:cytochrome d ubiquinol oxidase subunit II
MALDLPVIWAFIIALGVLMYVLLDGFDLGIGILFPFARSDRDRDVMMNSVAPVWDGNETWLVLGGGGLMGTFPIAYAVLMEAFYLPLIIMLLALIYRGVSFEFRFKSLRNRHWWDRSFAWGSALATFAQGVVLGTYIQGVPIANRVYAGGAFEWISPFAIFCGLALLAGYALLGAGWLVMKTEGELQRWARSLIRPLLLAVLAAIVLVSLWTPFVHSSAAERWFSYPNIVLLAPVPLLVALIAWRLWVVGGNPASNYGAFLLAYGLFVISYIGLGISHWPYIIPDQVTIWQAASGPKTQFFLLVGVAILLPIILAYTGYSYWVFRGKVRADEGYH